MIAKNNLLFSHTGAVTDLALEDLLEHMRAVDPNETPLTSAQGDRPITESYDHSDIPLRDCAVITARKCNLAPSQVMTVVRAVACIPTDWSIRTPQIPHSPEDSVVELADSPHLAGTGRTGSDTQTMELQGVEGMRTAIDLIADLGRPYTLSGDIAGVARILGDHWVRWQQDLESRRVPGYVLMSHPAPRVSTEDVRIQRSVHAADSAVITAGIIAIMISTRKRSAVVVRDPLVVGSLETLFWRLWRMLPPTMDRVPTKLDYMQLPERATRSGWRVPDDIASQIRATARATYLLNLGVVRDSYRALARLLPDVQLHYSIKTNPDNRVLRLLHELGCSFEAASYHEIELALDAGAVAEEIVFSAPVKERCDIAKAHKRGVALFVVDSECEIRKVADLAPGADCLVRVHTTAEQGALIKPSTKFGVGRQELVSLLSVIRESGLTPAGIAFNVGGQNEESASWRTALDQAHELVDLCETAGFRLDTIDIGGGFPVPVNPRVPGLEQIAPLVNERLRDLTYLAEPGRILVGDAGKLVAPVVSRSTRDGRKWLYVNASLFGLLQMLDRHRFHFPITTDRISLDTDEYVISSLSCDGGDILATGRVLPAGIDEGDLLIFHFVGAYSAPVFNIGYGGTVPAEMRYME